MILSVMIVTAVTPPGVVALAGRRVVDFLHDAVADLAPHAVVETADLPAGVQQLEGSERVLLLYSDRPLLTASTLAKLLNEPQAPAVALVGPDGEASAACADRDWLARRAELSPAGLAQAAGQAVIAPSDPTECLAVRDLPALAEAERIMRQRINRGWMQAGVQLADPATTYIHATVAIGRGTVILPNTHLWGQTTIGAECRVGPNSIIRDSQLGDRCVVLASVVEQAMMEDESDIGPFGHLRKGARMCRGAHMGNFGEMKNSTLGPNSKMGHFSYLGDATVGENVNIGAGTITCNYDGVNKHKTTIHDGVFIGSDAMLVAPLVIGAGAQIGAGSVVTRDVPAGAVAYGVPARVHRFVSEEGEGESWTR